MDRRIVDDCDTDVALCNRLASKDNSHGFLKQFNFEDVVRLLVGDINLNHIRTEEIT